MTKWFIIRDSKGQCSTNLIAYLLASFLLFGLSGLGVSAQAISSGPTGEYLLGPEDQLDISIWKEVDLNKRVIVRPDGRISFPLVGELQVAGRSVSDIQNDITKRVRKYIPEALASVSVAAVASYRIYVLGEVKTPGQYVLGTYVDVIKAITLAEGLTPYAEQKDIKIIRRSGGKEQVFHFNYEDTKKGKNLKQNIVLESGDVVVVP